MIDHDVLPFFLEEADELLVQWEDLCLGLNDQDTPETHNALFRIAHNLKGSSRACGLKHFGEIIHEIEDVITRLKNQELKGTDLIEFLFKSKDLLGKWVTGLKSDADFTPEGALIQDVLGLCHHFKGSAAASPEVAVDVVAEVAVLPEAQASAPASAPVAIPKEKEKVSAKAQESFRVNADKVEKLIFGIGELTVYKSMLEYAVKSGRVKDKSIIECIESLSKTCLDLQTNSFSLRLISAESLMKRLQRVVFDVAKATGKEVEFLVEGGSQEIDKVVLDMIVDPLVHILRNSVDHGIELPEKRQAAGKSPKGTVKIRLETDSGSLKFVISDDGGGINGDRVLGKAVEKGLVAPGARLTEGEKLNLIFLPGFSTAEKLSDISGRGVGMDVVKSTIDRLGGQVSISSELGKGSVFSLSIPTSLNLIDCFITETGASTCLIPINQVSEVISLNEYRPIVRNGLSGVVWRDNVIPLTRIPTAPPRGGVNDEGMGLIVSLHGKYFALTIGRISGTQQVFLRAPEGATVKSSFIKGNAILNNGKASMVLDVEKAIEKTFQAA